MTLTLDLTKSKQALVLNLQKAGISSTPKIDVAFAIDVSGSFDDEHRAGVTNDLLTRLIPWATVFDPDQKMEVYTFSNGEKNVHHAGDVSVSNYAGFVKREVIDCPGYMGGTDYSFVLTRILQDFGWLEKEKLGFFAQLFQSKQDAEDSKSASTQRQTLVFILTDGENYDTAKTESLLDASQKRADGVYFHFIGVSNQAAAFPFIEKMGDHFSNVGFTAVNNVRKWVAQPDDAINQSLISQELIAWIKTASHT